MNRFPRRNPTSVSRSSRASCTARLDGAETDATTGMPATHAFWMISKPPRPLTIRTFSESGSFPASNAQPTTLSTALWRPTSSRSAAISPRVSNSPAACKPPVRPKIACASRRLSGRRHSTCGSSRRFGLGGSMPRTRTCSMVALPQMPQLDAAKKFRCVCSRLSAASPSSSTWTTLPRSRSPSPALCSSERICSRSRISPSVKRNPAASSRSWPGVRMVTVSGTCQRGSAAAPRRPGNLGSGARCRPAIRRPGSGPRCAGVAARWESPWRDAPHPRQLADGDHSDHCIVVGHPARIQAACGNDDVNPHPAAELAADSTPGPFRKSGLHAQQVELQLGVAVLLRPEIQGNRGKLIHNWDGKPVLGEVHGLDVHLAGVAGLDAHVLELAGCVSCQLLKPLLPAARADDLAVVPLRQAERANQGALGPMALLAQNSHLRLPRAHRAGRRPEAGQFDLSAAGEMFGVGLQERPGKKQMRLRRSFDHVTFALPISGKQVVPVVRLLALQFLCSLT